MIRQTWLRSIFVRLVLTFILILLPLFIIGFSIYNWGIKTVKYEITSSMHAQIDFYKNNLEQELQRIRILQYDILNDASLDTLAYASSSLNDYDRDQNLNRVQQRLDAIKSSSRYITQIKIIIPGINKSINTPSILDLEKIDDELVAQSPAMSNLKLNYLEKTSILKDNLIILKADSSNFVKNNDSSPLFYTFILFSAAEIANMLHEMQIYEGGGSFLFSDSNSLMIDSSDHKDLSFKIMNHIKTHALDGSKMSHPKTAFFDNDYIVEFDKKQYYITYANIKQLGLTMVRYTPIAQVFQKIDHYRSLFWFFSLTALIIIFVFSFSTYRVIHRPLSKLVKAFYRVEKGDMTVEIKHNHQDEFNHIYERFNLMLSNLNSLIDQVYRQKLLLQNAELKQLQTQINPHFLYNSFFILNRWIQRGYTDEAVRFSKQLGNYFQFITRSAAEEIPLSREVEHARTYTEIQTMRFSNRMVVEFKELPEKWGHMMVPRLLLQPVIENVFNHGLKDVAEDGKLIVDFQMNGSFLQIIVEDNGQSLSNEDIANMSEQLDSNSDQIEITGIHNIHRRMRLKFGEASGVIIGRGELGGLKIILRIELKGV